MFILGFESWFFEGSRVCYKNNLPLKCFILGSGHDLPKNVSKSTLLRKEFKKNLLSQIPTLWTQSWFTPKCSKSTLLNKAFKPKKYIFVSNVSFRGLVTIYPKMLKKNQKEHFRVPSLNKKVPFPGSMQFFCQFTSDIVWRIKRLRCALYCTRHKRISISSSWMDGRKKKPVLLHH